MHFAHAPHFLKNACGALAARPGGSIFSVHHAQITIPNYTPPPFLKITLKSQYITYNLTQKKSNASIRVTFFMNHDVNFKCFVRRSHFTKNNMDKNIYDPCIAFALQSISGKILTFHIMTDYGMLRSRVPISEIFTKPPGHDIPYHYKQLWDCFGEKAEVISYEYLKQKRCQVILKDKKLIWATYMFTVDWYDNPYSEEPTDYKCGHILAADDGYLLCQPNNRIYWKDSNFICRNFPIDKKDIKVDHELLSVETASDKWVSEDTDSFYYNINENGTN